MTGSLDRFVIAQQRDHATALAELRAGAKRSHWMWYIFPQLRGLGQSAMAETYGIADLAEARAYLAHPVLGALLAHRGKDVVAILGSIDAMKLRSSMTLFERAAANTEPRFAAVLDAFYAGARDPVTLRLLG